MCIVMQFLASTTVWHGFNFSGQTWSLYVKRLYEITGVTSKILNSVLAEGESSTKTKNSQHVTDISYNKLLEPLGPCPQFALSRGGKKCIFIQCLWRGIKRLSVAELAFKPVQPPVSGSVCMTSKKCNFGTLKASAGNKHDARPVSSLLDWDHHEIGLRLKPKCELGHEIE